MNNYPFNFDLLKKLSETPGISGREERVADLIRSSLPANCECRSDSLGNLIAHIPGDGKRVMLVAHMDEVGLMVQRILPGGFLKVTRIGGISLRAMPGSRLSLWTSGKRIPAQVGIMPGHLDNYERMDFNQTFIDLGTSTEEETHALGVQPGDVLTWEASLQRLGDNLISGKALDDRLGCYVLIQLAKMLKPEKLRNDLYLVFTVQEETMLLGGNPAVNEITPEVIIGVDGTLTFDTPDLEGQQSDIRLGKGPAFKWMDAIRGKMAAFVPDQELGKHIRAVAEKNHIELQNEVVTGMSTAITPMMFAGKGTVAAALSIPIRYHHTPIETADQRDVDKMIDLLLNLLRIQM